MNLGTAPQRGGSYNDASGLLFEAAKVRAILGSSAEAVTATSLDASDVHGLVHWGGFDGS